MRLILAFALIGFLGPIGALMGFNFYVDRFQYYRPWSGPSPIFSTNERWQNAGLARSYRYDTVIVGTSRSQNFSAAMFAPAGWQVMKLTAAGSSSHIQARTLELAIGTGQVRRAIVELSYNTYLAPENYLRTDLTFPEFLYRPGLETPFAYLLSYDLYQESKKVLKGRAPTVRLDQIGTWWERHADKFGKNLYLADLALDCQPFAELPAGWRGDYPAMDAAIEANLARLVRAYPEVEFLAFLPPFPITWFGSAGLNGRQEHLGFRQRVYALAAAHPNLRLFDFALMADLVTDPRRYKDLGHYDLAANEAMAKALIDGAYEVEGEADATAANARLSALAERFDWPRWTDCRPPADGPAVAARSGGR
jgi:hypothetical protein